MSRKLWTLIFGVFATISLYGCKQEPATTTTTQEPAVPAANSAASPVSTTDAINVTVDADGFHPAKVTIPAGKPSVLRFTRTVEKTCTTAVVFHGLDLRRELPVGTPVDVTLTPKAAGTLEFACPMGMSTGTVTITPAPEK